VTRRSPCTSWARDQRGLPVSVTDPDGGVGGYVYGQAGQLTKTTAPQAVTRVYGGSPPPASPLTLRGYTTFGVAAETIRDRDRDGVRRGGQPGLDREPGRVGEHPGCHGGGLRRGRRRGVGD
jgi:YD repeat-containing protein